MNSSSKFWMDESLIKPLKHTCDRTWLNFMLMCCVATANSCKSHITWRNFSVIIRMFILIITIWAAVWSFILYFVLIIAMRIFYYKLEGKSTMTLDNLFYQVFFLFCLRHHSSVSQSFSRVSYQQAEQAPCTGKCSSCRRWCLLGNRSGQGAHGTYLEAHSQPAHTKLACSISYQHRWWSRLSPSTEKRRQIFNEFSAVQYGQLTTKCTRLISQ